MVVFLVLLLHRGLFLDDPLALLGHGHCLSVGGGRGNVFNLLPGRFK